MTRPSAAREQGLDPREAPERSTRPARSETPVTTVDGIVPLCRWEHYLVTHCGYTLEPLDDGQYRLVPPPDPQPDPGDPERGPP